MLALPTGKRDLAVARVLILVLFLNLLVAGLKLFFGYLAGSVSMLADGLHSSLDGASNVVGLVGLSIAAQEPDEDHPYGHRKFEALASIGISMFLFFTSYEVFREVLARFRGEHEVDPSIASFVVMGITVVINLAVTRYERKKAEELRSTILKADAAHTMSDVFVSIAVIVSLIAAVLKFPILDVVVALIIVFVIARAGFHIVSNAFSILSDTQMLEPKDVVAVAESVDGVLHAHRVRSRGTVRDIHVDLHIHVDPEMTTRRSHNLAHQVTDEIQKEFPDVADVVVHVEPQDHEHP